MILYTDFRRIVEATTKIHGKETPITNQFSTRTKGSGQWITYTLKNLPGTRLTIYENLKLSKNKEDQEIPVVYKLQDRFLDMLPESKERTGTGMNRSFVDLCHAGTSFVVGAPPYPAFRAAFPSSGRHEGGTGNRFLAAINASDVNVDRPPCYAWGAKRCVSTNILTIAPFVFRQNML